MASLLYKILIQAAVFKRTQGHHEGKLTIVAADKIKKADQRVTAVFSEQVKYKPSRLQFGVLLFGLVAILLSWGVTLHQLSENKTSLLQGLVREQGNLSSVLTENLYQILEKKQTIAMLAANKLDNYRNHFPNDINSFLYGESAFTRIVLYDLTGEVAYQSSPGSEGQYQTNMVALAREVIASGQPVFAERTAFAQVSWQIPILFPLIIEDETKGAMLLELDIGYLLNLLKDIDIGRTGKILITNDQNLVLASFESGGMAVEGSLPKQFTLPFLQDVSGSVVIDNPELRDYLTAYRKVRGYPFIVLVSQEIDEYLSDYNTHKKKLLWILSALTSLCFAGLYVLLRMIDKNHEYLYRLSASLAKNSELIQKLEEEHQASTKAASVDALTGLYNRRLFIYLAQKKLSSARRNRLTYAVLFIDLDRFKTINDTLGHRVGDLLLKEVGKRLTGSTRASDIVARFGGDEFVVMLAGISEEQDIVPIVKKIIEAVSEPCDNLDGHLINTSPSIGIAVYPRDGNDIESLLLNADAAMYKSKKAGRGVYRFFDASLNKASLQDFELEQRMPSAISGNEFVLHYQPKVRLADFRVVGLEALIRWKHPSQPLIYPNDFIDLAEKSGLIALLGAWTLEQVCRQIITWRTAGLNPVPVALNVSPLELQDSGYANQFLQTVNRFQVAPEFIEMEITENAFIEERDAGVRNLRILSENGIKISMDDFGKGFSNLDNVRSLPIDTLKIDRTFIKDIRNNYNDNSIVYSTISLAQKLNLKVIAEGVETSDQLRNLKVAGCDQVQGYYFSRPVPEEEIREFILSPIRSPIQ